MAACLRAARGFRPGDRIGDLAQCLRVGQGRGVAHLAPVDDVRDRQFDELAGAGPGQIVDRDDQRRHVARCAALSNLSTDRRFELVAEHHAFGQTNEQHDAHVVVHLLAERQRLEDLSHMGDLPVDLSGADAKFQQTLAVYEARQEGGQLQNNFFLAISHFYLAHIAHKRFRDLPLRLPQKQLALDLDGKAKTFLLANTKYVETIKLKNPTWATAAGYHVGTLYRELYDAMITAPVPTDVNRGDSRVIYDLLLREQLRHLLTKAKDVLESNVKMAERIGVKNGWIERSTEQLGELDKLISGLDQPTQTAPSAPTQTPSRPAPRDGKSRATL